MRGRAVSPEEVLRALERGGFDFDLQGWKDEKTRLRNLSISMGKNTAIFHRLPNGTYGLVKFYPAVQAEKKRRAQPGETPETDASEAAADGGTETTTREPQKDKPTAKAG